MCVATKHKRLRDEGAKDANLVVRKSRVAQKYPKVKRRIEK